MEEDKTVLLFRQIQAATKNGHDAEVRRDKDGNFVVYSVKKQRADKIQVKLHSAESSGLRCVSERTLCKAQRTP